MRYRVAGSEYSPLNYYEIGDYVVYQGKTYRLNFVAHSPNTASQVGPGQAYRWSLVADYPINTWYRYQIYQPGDQITYNGKTYQCLEIDCNQLEPPNSLYWLEL